MTKPLLKSSKSADHIEWETLTKFIKTTKEDGYYKISFFATLSTFFLLRVSECLHLKWSDILNKDEFVLLESKNNRKDRSKPKMRKITISKTIQNEINSAYQYFKVKNPNNFIFLNNSINNPKPFTRQYINKTIKQLFNKYGFKFNNLSSHSFRKSYCREYLDKNKYSPYAFQILGELLNHRDTWTTKRYLGILDEEIQEVYNSLKL